MHSQLNRSGIKKTSLQNIFLVIFSPDLTNLFYFSYWWSPDKAPLWSSTIRAISFHHQPSAWSCRGGDTLLMTESRWAQSPLTLRYQTEDWAHVNISFHESMAHLNYWQSAEILMGRWTDESEKRWKRGVLVIFSIPVSSGSSHWCIFIWLEGPSSAFVLFRGMLGRAVCMPLYLISVFVLSPGLLFEAT